MKAAGLWALASGLPDAVRRARGVYFGWVMVGLGALILALGSAPMWGGLPVWSPVLRNQFGWTTVQLSWAFAVTRMEGGLLGPLEGLLIQRLGTRRVVFFGMIMLGSAMVLFSRIQELWQLYATFFLMSMGTALCTWLPIMTLVNHWFVRHKARAMSFVLEGAALGAIASPVLLAWAIGGSDPAVSERFGWRNSAMLLGFLTIALAFPLSSMLRNRPGDMGLGPDGDLPITQARPATRTAGSSARTARTAYSWREAIRTRTFWLISIGHACSAVVNVSIFVHLGLILDDRGFSLQAISTVVATHTGVNAVFILLGGYLGDRVPIRLMAFGCTLLMSSVAVVLVLAHNELTLYLFAVLLGVAAGLRAPVMVALRGHYFRPEAYAAISGMSMVPMNIFLFTGPLFAGFMRDATGDYDFPFLVIAAVCLFGAFLFLGLGEPPGRLAGRR